VHDPEFPGGVGKLGQAATHFRGKPKKFASGWWLNATFEAMVSGTHFGLAYLLLDISHDAVEFSGAHYEAHQGRDVCYSSQSLDETARYEISKDVDLLQSGDTNNTGDP
jgi:hypothetical protein